MVSNLDAAGDDIQPIFFTNGFAAGFLTGAGSYNLDSVKLPEYGYSGPVSYFHVELYSLGPVGSVPPPGWPLVPVAQLSNAGTLPSGGTTTLVEYHPGGPLTLSPGHVYFIGVTGDAGSPGVPSVIFASSESYTVGADWQMYVSASMNQWMFDPNHNEWVEGAPNGIEGLKLEIDASPIPEPTVVSILSVALVIASRGARFCRWMR
jgi:hypothetical protein